MPITADKKEPNFDNWISSRKDIKAPTINHLTNPNMRSVEN